MTKSMFLKEKDLVLECHRIMAMCFQIKRLLCIFNLECMNEWNIRERERR